MSSVSTTATGGESFADLFAQSLKSQDMKSGEVISADPATGEVRLPSGQVLRSKPFSERMVQIWQAGGTIPLLEREFAARRAAASGQGNAT